MNLLQAEDSFWEKMLEGKHFFIGAPTRLVVWGDI